MDKTNCIKGDFCLLVGDLETELKFGLTIAFTNTSFSTNGNNAISPTKIVTFIGS